MQTGKQKLLLTLAPGIGLWAPPGTDSSSNTISKPGVSEALFPAGAPERPRSLSLPSFHIYVSKDSALGVICQEYYVSIVPPQIIRRMKTLPLWSKLRRLEATIYLNMGAHSWNEGVTPGKSACCPLPQQWCSGAVVQGLCPERDRQVIRMKILQLCPRGLTSFTYVFIT